LTACFAPSECSILEDLYVELLEPRRTGHGFDRCNLPVRNGQAKHGAQLPAQDNGGRHYDEAALAALIIQISLINVWLQRGHAASGRAMGQLKPLLPPRCDGGGES
jgi:hypothetical protein